MFLYWLHLLHLEWIALVLLKLCYINHIIGKTLSQQWVKYLIALLTSYIIIDFIILVKAKIMTLLAGIASLFVNGITY